MIRLNRLIFSVYFVYRALHIAKTGQFRDTLYTLYMYITLCVVFSRSCCHWCGETTKKGSGALCSICRRITPWYAIATSTTRSYTQLFVMIFTINSISLLLIN